MEEITTEKKLSIIDDWMQTLQNKMSNNYNHCDLEFLLEQWQKQISVLKEYKSYLQRKQEAK